MAMTDDSRSDNAFERDKPGTHARTEAETAIEELAQRGGVFVNAVRATSMPMVLTDPTLPGNPIVFANQAFLKLSGYRMDEVLGQQPHFMNGSGTDPKDARRFVEMLRSERDDILETVQYRKDGSSFVATLLLSAFKDEDGRTLNHFMSWLDVTRQVDAEKEVSELRRIQKALQAGEAKYRGLLDSIDEGFCIIEVLFDGAEHPTDYVFLETNSAFERQTGIVQPAGKRMRDIAPDHEQHWFDTYGRIALTGTPERFEQPAEALGRYYDVYAFRVGDPLEKHVAILFNDISDRKRSEQAARENEERQAFLLKLADALRQTNDAAEIQATTARMVGEHLGADRAMYAEVEGEKGSEHGTLRGQYVRPGGEEPAEPFPDHFTYGQFGQHTMAARYRGEPLIVADVQTDPAYSAEERAAWAQFGVRAAVVATLPKGGRLVAEFGLHSTTPRQWTEAEITIIKEAAERTWAAAERARAEQALRDSEEKYRTLFDTIDSGYALTDNVRDEEGRVVDLFGVDFNRSYTQHSGLPPFAGRRASEVINLEPEWLRQFEEVTRTGVPARYENHIAERDRWVSTHYSLVGDLGSDRVAVVFDDITDRKRAEAGLRESEDRQAFLLALGDAMRTESTADGKIEAAARLLGEKLRASRVFYAEYDHQKGLAHIFNGWLSDGAQPFPSVVRLEEFEGAVLNDLREGRVVRVDNVGALGAEPGYAAIANVGVQALLSPPLLVDGKLKFNISIHQHEPRHWTDNEVALVQEVSERLWAEIVRARAEEAMRDSQERLRLIVESARDYAIFTTDADLRVTRWLPGAQSVFGWTKEEIEGRSADILFTQEDRADGAPQEEAETALRDGKAPDIRWHLRKDGRRVFIEGQVVPLREGGRHHGFLKIGQDVTVRRAAEEALRDEQRRQQTLLAELQHRVRNTLAVIRSIVRRTAQSSDSVEDFEQHLDGRLSAFARTQAYVTRDPDGGIDLELIVRDELLAHAADGGPAVSIQGPEVRLSAKQAETIGLAVHELTSNAIKHGALCDEGNRIEVAWSIEGAAAQRKLHFRWIERLRDRRLAPPKRNGFGTELLDRVMRYELDAEPEIAFKPTGFEYRAIFPLAPVPAKSLT